jgi:excisionase family DNA binding protein
MNQKLLLDIKEAAERLNIGRSLLYQLVIRGEIASVKIGRARRIPIKALDAYVERLLADQGEAE